MDTGSRQYNPPLLQQFAQSRLGMNSACVRYDAIQRNPVKNEQVRVLVSKKTIFGALVGERKPFFGSL